MIDQETASKIESSVDQAAAVERHLHVRSSTVHTGFTAHVPNYDEQGDYALLSRGTPDSARVAGRAYLARYHIFDGNRWHVRRVPKD